MSIPSTLIFRAIGLASLWCMIAHNPTSLLAHCSRAGKRHVHFTHPARTHQTNTRGGRTREPPEGGATLYLTIASTRTANYTALRWQPVMPHVDLTSAVKSCEPLFYVFMMFFHLRASAEPEPGTDDG